MSLAILFYMKHFFHYCMMTKLFIDKEYSFLHKRKYCNSSNISEFHQDYESASYIQFGEGLIFSIL